jgi:hypothetical protein
VKRRDFLKGLVAVAATASTLACRSIVYVPPRACPEPESCECDLLDDAPFDLEAQVAADAAEAFATQEDLVFLTQELKQGYDPVFVMSERTAIKLKKFGVTVTLD